MRMTINGVVIPNPESGLNVHCELDGNEKLPEMNVAVTGGRLDVYKSAVTTQGEVSIHLFQEKS